MRSGLVTPAAVRAARARADSVRRAVTSSPVPKIRSVATRPAASAPRGPDAAMWTSMSSGAQLRTLAASCSSLAQVLGVRPTEWQAPSPVARPAKNRPG